jgi:hypothetical protein
MHDAVKPAKACQLVYDGDELTALFSLHDVHTKKKDVEASRLWGLVLGRVARGKEKPSEVNCLARVASYFKSVPLQGQRVSNLV